MKNNNLLYLGECIGSVSSGADQVNKRNQKLLESFYTVTYIPIIPKRFSKVFLSVSNAFLKVVDEKLDEGIFGWVFVPQSLLGRACVHIKKRYPEIKIMVFFHNIEVQYAREYLKTAGIKALPFYLIAAYWEKQACVNSEYCITLNERDSDLLRRIYDIKSDLELPTSFSDCFDAERNAASFTENKGVIDYLFVGVSFFANIDAVQWFIDKVMPEVDGHFYVVGKGMERVAFKNLSPKIHIVGFVEDVSDFYYRAKIVVSPIFVGGGMKTKTAEALMYGKTILGTAEAFEGYHIDDRCMVKCESPKEYVEAIGAVKSQEAYNKFARELFLQYYSEKASYRRMERLLDSLK